MPLTRTPASEAARLGAGKELPDKGTRFQFGGKTLFCPEGVYFPSEDSYFLAQTVKAGKGAFVIDVGSGTGIQAINALMHGASRALCLDLNPLALEASALNCRNAGFGEKAEARKSDLLSCCEEAGDTVVFNPPYVPSGAIRFLDLDGGMHGRATLDRFLRQLPGHLAENGECYFLQTDINGYEETEGMLAKLGMHFETAARRKGFFEELAVYRCWCSDRK